MGAKSQGIYPTVLFIVIIACVLGTALYAPHVLRAKEGFAIACPRPSAPFNEKLFIDREECYAGTGPDCESVMIGMFGDDYERKFNGANPDNVRRAVNLMSNNRYRKKDSKDDGAVYAVNECVIPDYEGSTLKLSNCVINGKVRLQPSSTSERQNGQVEWDHSGCVVTEEMIRNNFGQIAQEITDFFDGPKDKMEVDVSNANQQNIQKTQVYNNEFTSATIAEADADRKRVQAITEKRTMEDKRGESKFAEMGFNKKRSEYGDAYNRIMRSGGVIEGRAPDMFYRVFRGYFASYGGSETLNLFRNTYPYECGTVSTVNDFAGMRGYPQGKWTQRVSVEITCVFVPPVTGMWRFALTSDDSSYMWIEETRVAYDRMDVGSALIKNPGWHGDVRVEASKTLVGTDSGGKVDGYRIKIVQGNDGGPGTLVVHMLRPGGSVWEVLGNTSSELMFYRELRTGLMAKVSQGYFWDNPDAIKLPRNPLVAWELDEAYQLPRKYWNANFGITGGGRYEDFSRIMYTNGSLQNVSAYHKGHGFNTGWAFAEHDQRNINIYGLFFPPVAGRYTFYIASDDAAYLWVNESANDYKIGNALLNNGGLHGTTMKKVDYTVGPSMVGKPMPIRIVQGDWGGGNTLVFAYRLPGDTNASYDLKKYFKY